MKSIYRDQLDYDLEVNSNLPWLSPHASIGPKAKIGSNVVVCSGAQLEHEVSIDQSVISWGVSLSETESALQHQMLL